MIINFSSLGGGSSKLSASAFTDVVLNTSASTLDFYNINGDLVEQFDASALIIDGMVEDVYLSGTTLVIDFNTASGQQDIEIDLTEFINPEMYYTSAQTDTLIASAKNEVYASATTYTDNAILAAKNDVYASATTYTDNAISGIDLSAAVASANTYTDGEVSALTAHLSDVERVTSIALNELKGDISGITVPTKLSDLDNDEGFVDSGDVETQIEAYNYIDSGQAQTQINDSLGGYYTSGQTDTVISTAVADKVSSNDVVNIVKISQSDYDAMSAHSSTTLYVIED